MPQSHMHSLPEELGCFTKQSIHKMSRTPSSLSRDRGGGGFWGEEIMQINEEHCGRDGSSWGSPEPVFTS